MSVSDDIGSLVLVLSERLMLRYYPEAPRADQARIEEYFQFEKYLLRHTREPAAFSEKLPLFKQSVTEMTQLVCEQLDDAIDEQKIFTRFLTAGTLLSGAACAYSAITRYWDMAPVSFLATGGLLVVQGYTYLKRQHTKRLRQRIEQCDASASQASLDLWREAFTHYHPMMSEDVVDFSYFLRPETTRREEDKAKV